MEIPEEHAAIIFRTAIEQHKASELLTCLFNGGAVTMGPQGEVVMIQPESLEQMVTEEIKKEDTALVTTNRFVGDTTIRVQAAVEAGEGRVVITTTAWPEDGPQDLAWISLDRPTWDRLRDGGEEQMEIAENSAASANN